MLIQYLFKDSESYVGTIRVDNEGSRPQYVNVEVQNVSSSGVIDTEGQNYCYWDVVEPYLRSQA